MHELLKEKHADELLEEELQALPEFSSKDLDEYLSDQAQDVIDTLSKGSALATSF